ncbi:FHA domain-containing protein [Streptomyces sp. NPDC050560]|uniref:FHA domain-containing protein n=1 Tax=Streptomyces sp. NPDC050560 TaxID=3365630 RepID=UPI00378F3F81
MRPLRLVFDGGHLDVARGEELRLGRSRGWAPRAYRLLADETSVSARHATVVHTPDGASWVTEVPQGASNGTRLNDRVLRPGSRARMHDDDRVWLGPRVSFTVHGVGRETGEAREPREARETGESGETRETGEAGGTREKGG